jgi:hypothetical protein
MKQLLTAALVVAMAALVFGPVQLFAASDTLTVYATTATLDKIIRGDTLANGTRAHHVYRLPSTDTTYWFDATITVNTDFAVIGVPKAGTGKLPCIQPEFLAAPPQPGVLFTLAGTHTTGTFKNLYLLGIASNNSVNFGGGQAIQVSADSIKIVADNVIFEQWSQFAIGYSSSWDKFFITNCKFRNMTTQPNQWYVGEVLRNENYVAAFPTDSIVLKYNTILCVGGYATAATGGIVHYYDFSHNNMVYNFKNPFFIDRAVNARFDNNIFYCTYAGGQNKTEFNGGWDQFTAKAIANVISTDILDSTTAARLLGHARATPADSIAAEAARNIRVLNNVYFWPSAITTFWKTNWNDTAHVDSISPPVWMNARTANMFSDKVHWPGFSQSGNQNVDPGFGASIAGVLNAGTGTNVGLLKWFAVTRNGTGTTETWGYNPTQVGSAANWTPPWPLPEAADMQYSSTALKTGATDHGPIGDPNWFGIVLSAPQTSSAAPQTFALSQNYPNPFNPSTKIDFTIPSNSLVQLKVYNLLGQEVATLVNGTLTSGTHTVTFDASKLSSGIYMYKITAGSFVSTRKMVLLK